MNKFLLLNFDAKDNVSMVIQYHFVNPNEKSYSSIYTNCQRAADAIVQS